MRLRRIGVGITHEHLGGLEIAQHPQGPDGRQPQQPLASPVILQGLLRANPDLINGLDAVMTGRLPFRCDRHEEPRIKPPRRPRWRNPVAQIRQPVQRNRQAMLCAQAGQRQVTVKDRLPITMGRMITVHQPTLLIHREQNPGLLKTFANRRQHVIRAALVDTHGLTDLRVAGPDHMLTPMGLMLLDPASGKHKIAGHEHRIPGALQQQDFNTV